MDQENTLHALGIDPSPPAEKSKTTMASVAWLAFMPASFLSFFRKLSKGLGGKIAMGVLCTALWGAIKDAPAIWHGVRVFFSFVGTLGDSKTTTIIKETFAKGGEIVKQQTAPSEEEDKPKPTVKERLKSGVAKAKEATKEVAHNTAVAVEEKAKPIEKDARKAVDDIKDRLGPPRTEAGPLDGAMGAIRPNTPPVQGSNMGMGGVRPPQPTVLGGLGKGIKDTGNAIGKGFSDYAKGQADQVERDRPMMEEFARWWDAKGSNATCPNCRLPMRLLPSASTPRTCLKCGATYYPKVALATPPPMPRTPTPAFMIYWRKKCAAPPPQSPSPPSASPPSK